MTQGKILIIDDDVVSSKILSGLLVKKGFQVEVLDDAFEYLNNPEKFDMDLMLLDLMMPKISGNEVLKKVRETKSSVELPIIIVTSKDEQEVVVENLRSGANDYLVKPVNIEIAVARINSQISAMRLNNQNLEFKELETLNSMIATYNHEIINPLTIAITNQQLGLRKLEDEKLIKCFKTAHEAMLRISDIVKKIENVTQMDEVEKSSYTDDVKTYKLK